MQGQLIIKWSSRVDLSLSSVVGLTMTLEDLIIALKKKENKRNDFDIISWLGHPIL